MNISHNELLETIRMIQLENLDIRTVTMGINLQNCADSNFEDMKKMYITKSFTMLYD